MATISLNDFAVTSSWQDVCASVTGLTSVDATIVNLGNAMVFVVSGGASVPTTKSGVPLAQYESTYVSSDHIWVRTIGSDSKVAVSTL